MKREQASGRLAAHNFYFCGIMGQTEHVNIFDRAGCRVQLNARQAFGVMKTSAKWNIVCLALLRSPEGYEDWVSMTISAQEPMVQEQAHQALSHAHYDWVREMIDSGEINTSELLTLGWISTAGAEPSPNVVNHILDSMQAWKGLGPLITTDDGNWKINYTDERGVQ